MYYSVQKLNHSHLRVYELGVERVLVLFSLKCRYRNCYISPARAYSASIFGTYRKFSNAKCFPSLEVGLWCVWIEKNGSCLDSC
jgi:hypothetical protein